MMTLEDFEDWNKEISENLDWLLYKLTIPESETRYVT